MTHTEIINLWPSLTEFAEDHGIAYGTAKAMRRRSSIPATYWTDTVTKAKARGLKGVTLEVLAKGAKQAVAA